MSVHRRWHLMEEPGNIYIYKKRKDTHTHIYIRPAQRITTECVCDVYKPVCCWPARQTKARRSIAPISPVCVGFSFATLQGGERGQSYIYIHSSFLYILQPGFYYLTILFYTFFFFPAGTKARPANYIVRV